LDVSLSEQQDNTDSDVDCDASSRQSIASDHSTVGTKNCRSSSQSSNSMKFCITGQSDKNSDMDEDDYVCLTPSSSARKTDTKQQHQYNAASYTKQPCQASLSFWPRWAYEMYDSYALARRAAGR
jgi:cereblon